MASYYTYLISSLPILNFSIKMPFSLKVFFAKCKGLIPETEIEILHNACYQDIDFLNTTAGGCLKKWVNFEVTLRNELARVRARGKKIDPAKFIRFPDHPQFHISHVAMAAHRHSANVLEAEKILDQERWDFLEQLSFGHYFDFDFLLIYALKLKILERWDKAANADKGHLFDAVFLD
ncbi:MAG: DUF2764 family protein [Candidatus Omnitrophica bacterium]|nr:DUF2764 family protein [Candidatus Omnitrophota bacterium]